MNARRLGEAGLQGWRAKLADRAAPAIARRTSFDADQVRKVIGGLFLALAVLYVTKSTRELLRR